MARPARAGSVASVRNIKNPAKLAKLVMEQTDHVMLVGNGALEFAKTWGFKEENLLTEKSRLAWLVWKQSLRDATATTTGPTAWTRLRRQKPGVPNGDPAAVPECG